ncbi:MAG: NAD(P)/FAD-dependent oxidoreductase [Sphingobacteriales bacterium]|nr:MAG: NAD(P)/FAD-dependent oxidoreductase [Sphingobacteriales bacterium]
MKKVIIVGGGFAGLNLAKKISKSDKFQITLVDKNNYHFFPPLLYQVGTAFIEPSNISYPFRKLFQGRNIRYYMGSLVEVVAEQKTIITDNGTLEYDYLVLAMGTETNFFGNEQIAKNAFPMKTLDEALSMRNHILMQLEKATRTTDLKEKSQLANIVIAGGGPTGVELAGMIAEMSRNLLHKDYPGANLNHGKIYLIDGLNSLLAPMSAKSQEEAKNVLQMLDVSSGVINAGGDLLTWGLQPDNEPWTVAAADPEQENHPYAHVNISNMAMASAVNINAGTPANHTSFPGAINPKHGFKVSAIQSVSIIGPSAEFADAMATPLINMGINAGIYLINQLNQVACVVTDDNNRVYTSKHIAVSQQPVLV